MQDDQERLQFFADLAAKVNKPTSQDAYVYALVAGADVKLRLEDLDGARKDLNLAESILDTFDSVETEVHAAFYKTSASYYQVLLSKLANSPDRHSHSADYVLDRPKQNSHPFTVPHSSISPALTRALYRNRIPDA